MDVWSGGNDVGLCREPEDVNPAEIWHIWILLNISEPNLYTMFRIKSEAVSCQLLVLILRLCWFLVFLLRLTSPRLSKVNPSLRSRSASLFLSYLWLLFPVSFSWFLRELSQPAADLAAAPEGGSGRVYFSVWVLSPPTSHLCLSFSFHLSCSLSPAPRFPWQPPFAPLPGLSLCSLTFVFSCASWF